MGVPGDMNLELLDYIDEVDGLTWGKYCLLDEP
jgi:pyruvate decarboxylase